TQNTLTATFTCTDTTAGTTAFTVTENASSGQTITFSEPATTFTDGHHYTWTVGVTDGLDPGPTVSGDAFSVDHTAPPPPTVQPPASNGDPVALRTNGVSDPSFKLTDSGEIPSFYLWSLNVTPPSVLPTGTGAWGNWGSIAADASGAATLSLSFDRPGP